VKGPLVTLPVRRLAAALALGVALLTAGCGTTEANRAAVVDGRVISETTVQETMTQLNAMQPPLFQQALTPTDTLTTLLRAPIAIDYLDGKGYIASESVARQAAAERGVDDPGEGTLDVIRFATAISEANAEGAFGDTENLELSEALRQQDVEVNPRYGEFDPDTVAVTVTMPSWVTPFNAAQ
jgi:hypothetical protein